MVGVIVILNIGRNTLGKLNNLFVLVTKILGLPKMEIVIKQNGPEGVSYKIVTWE